MVKSKLPWFKVFFGVYREIQTFALEYRFTWVLILWGLGCWCEPRLRSSPRI